MFGKMSLTRRQGKTGKKEANNGTADFAADLEQGSTGR